MSKKHFIELADMIRDYNRSGETAGFDACHVEALADFCASQNSNFKRDRWLEYIAGNCGKNGGAIKKATGA